MMIQKDKNSLVVSKCFLGIEFVAKTVIIFSAVLIIAFCIWSLDRGFEITDESYYLLLAIYPKSVKLYISAQQWISSLIWQITGSLTTFRAAGMFILVASSSLLAIGSIKATSQSGLRVFEEVDGKALMFAASIICALLYSATINFSPCYNLLASAGAYTTAGFVLLALYTDSKWKQLGMISLAGVALGMEFVSKPPAGIVTLGLISAWIFVLDRSLMNKFINVTIILTTLALCIIILMAVQTTFTDVKFAFEHGLEMFRVIQIEPVGSRLERYFLEFTRYTAVAIKSFAVVILSTVMYLTTRCILFAGIVIVSLIYTILSGKYFFFGFQQTSPELYVHMMEPIFILFLLILLISMSAWKNNRQIIVLVAGLAILPYTIAVGTGNSIFTQVIISLAPWGVALAAIANLHFDNKTDKALTLTLFACFIVTISLHTFTNFFKAPYHMQQPIIKQSHPITIGKLGAVKVDSETAKFVNDLTMAVKKCNIAYETPFLGLYNVPGVALALETIPILSPWINNVAQADAFLEISHANIFHSYAIAILLNNNSNFPPLPKKLSLFPTGFQYCGTATYPFENQKIQIWYSPST